MIASAISLHRNLTKVPTTEAAAQSHSTQHPKQSVFLAHFPKPLAYKIGPCFAAPELHAPH